MWCPKTNDYFVDIMLNLYTILKSIPENTVEISYEKWNENQIEIGIFVCELQLSQANCNLQNHNISANPVPVYKTI